jgi:hypothetical protein
MGILDPAWDSHPEANDLEKPADQDFRTRKKRSGILIICKSSLMP